MGKLNKTPEGMLSLLASKTDGTNPSDLMEAVRPTLDLLAFYQTSLEAASFSGAFAGLGTDLVVVVPSNEIWLVHACHITAVYTSNAQTAILALKFTGLVNQNNVPVQSYFKNDVGWRPQSANTYAAGAAARLSHFFEKPFLLRAGQGIGGELMDFENVAGGDTLNGSMLVSFTKMLF